VAALEVKGDTMKLRCHAIKRSGEMCGARARDFRDGRPVCDRLQHSFAVSDLMRLTEESVEPYDLETVAVYFEFMGGASTEEIARRRGWERKRVEGVIRGTFG
jgi:hypothetical protein